MATITAAGSTWNSTNSPTTHTVVATPAANDLIVVVHGGSGWASGDTSVITDNNSDGNGTYTIIGSGPLSSGGGTTGALWISIRDSLVGSATSTTFTNTEVGLTGGGLTVFRVSGMTRTGASAARQNKGESDQTENPPSIAFAAATLTENPIILGVMGEDNPPALTAPADFSETFDSGWTTPTTGVWVGFINSGKTSSSYAWTGGAVTDHNEVGVELDTSSAGSTESGDGVSNGVGTVVGVSGADKATSGVSAGTATVTATGGSEVFTVGNSAATATVVGVSQGPEGAGVSAGTATVTATGGSEVFTVGNSAGVASVTGAGQAVLPGSEGISSGIATVSGVASSIASAEGVAAGVAAVTGISEESQAAVVVVTQVVGGGDLPTWQDFVNAEFRRKHLSHLLDVEEKKLERVEKKLKVVKKKLKKAERTEGVLANLQALEFKRDEIENKIHALRVEMVPLELFLEAEINEDDEEVMLVS